ncbi:hypothetical protein GUJ93_ZPchr0008g13634 [Zizania palustris]|uniref:WRKY domain-containing protein n=1 Tax=Zizania palustris TaxID=103762 RepID=A0A8J5QXI3_ZIZPA|nr:hypothetical protein GUJ93_ZPchr0008g13634 [Zizania palustris]
MAASLGLCHHETYAAAAAGGGYSYPAPDAAASSLFMVDDDDVCVDGVAARRSFFPAPGAEAANCFMELGPSEYSLPPPVLAGGNEYGEYYSSLSSPSSSRIGFRTRSEVEVLDDGFKWRKYGKKAVKSSPNPRNYYRCSAAGCGVKKRVERDRDDPRYVVTTYDGIHNHATPGTGAGGGHSYLASPAATAQTWSLLAQATGPASAPPRHAAAHSSESSF